MPQTLYNIWILYQKPIDGMTINHFSRFLSYWHISSVQNNVNVDQLSGPFSFVADLPFHQRKIPPISANPVIMIWSKASIEFSLSGESEEDICLTKTNVRINIYSFLAFNLVSIFCHVIRINILMQIVDS